MLLLNFFVNERPVPKYCIRVGEARGETLQVPHVSVLRLGDLKTVRVREGPSGMTAGGGACSDGPSLACLRVEAGFFSYIFSN